MKNGKFTLLTLLPAVGCLAQAPAPYLADIRGGVSVSRPAGERAKAGKNMALAPGDLLTTGLHSRAAVRFDPAVRLWLEANGGLRMAQLEGGRYRLDLERGAVTCQVVNPLPWEIEIGTPSVAVRPSELGVYRIAINKAGESEILVRRGELEVLSPAGSQSVAAGQKLIARGDAANPEFRIVSGVSRWSRALTAFGNMVQVGADISSSGAHSGADSDSNSSSSSNSTSSSSNSGTNAGSAPAKEQASQPVSKPDPPVARSDDSASRSSPRTGSVK